MTTHPKAGRKDTSTEYRHGATSKPLVAREAAVAYGHDTVGVRELRQNLSVYLDEVKQGRSLIVTEHGQRVAVLQPVSRGVSVIDRLVAEGKMRPPTRRIQDLPPPLDIKLDKPLSQVLIEMREEERY